jgi:S-adenosylmethionine synthetase
MARKTLFTSESVAMGHPDKVADQISDGVLDAIIAQDKNCRVACETLVTTGMALVAGEITTSCYVEIPKIVRQTIKEIGYEDPALGFDWETCAVLTTIDEQSADIAIGVNAGQKKEQGAGDQGIMFGYACTETPAYMPAPIFYAHRMMERLAEARTQKEIKWLRPDGKGQFTLEYLDGKPVRIHTVVLSAQHAPEVTHDEIRRTLIEKVIKPVCPRNMIDDRTIYHVNPTGRFVKGGPAADTGVTGRKIIVDTYGGVGSHGGGAFSGKDPSKVDRSATYMARHLAKNVVAAGVGPSCEVQLAYAIGIAEPVSVLVEVPGLDEKRMAKVEGAIREIFPLKPRPIIEYLDLLRPIYQETARHGHFGREHPDFTWEKTDRVDDVRKALKL